MWFIAKESIRLSTKHETSTILLRVVDLILRGLDSGMATALILLDFSRAFDSVDHELLLAKLKYFGLTDRALLFFQRYLTDRQQFVRVHSGESESGQIKSGVPQGSILGPLLFLLYTFDLGSVTTFSQTQCYADDTQLIYTFDPLDYNDVKANDKILKKLL